MEFLVWIKTIPGWERALVFGLGPAVVGLLMHRYIERFSRHALTGVVHMLGGEVRAQKQVSLGPNGLRPATARLVLITVALVLFLAALMYAWYRG